MIRFLPLFLFFASLASAQSLPWHKVGTLKNSTGSYTPIVMMGGDQIRVFANTRDNKNDAATSGDYWLRVGSWSHGLGSATKVLDVVEPRDTFIRTSGVARGASGTYYAVLYTGDGYPTQGGYSPSWATSPDGYAWTWWGAAHLFGYNQSSAMNLIVDESRTDAYRCMYWMDLPTKFVLVHSASCETWDWQSDGINMWPIANEIPQFATAVKTPYAYHIMGAAYWDGTNHRPIRHLVSCDGLTNWRMVESASPVGASGSKGTNLAYDAATNLLHALTTGIHWTLPERDWGC